jgi:putative transposase
LTDVAPAPVVAEDSNAEVALAVSTDDQLIRQLTERAQAQGLSLTGEDGLLRQLTKLVLEAGLEAEMTGHLGYEKHQVEGRNGDNSRNGTRGKTVLTEVGPVEIEVPRDREGTFAPVTVRKRQRRLHGVDSMVISLVAKGMTTGDVQAHLAEVYGTTVSRETISNITDSVLEKLAEWQNRPLDQVYPVIFVDAINVKIRDGNVANRPVYVALGVTVDGHKDVLGLWVGDGGEGAKFWLRVLTEIKNRGVNDVCILVSDGLKGMTEAIETTWPQTVHQTCVVHLLRNSFAYASKAHWSEIARDLKPVYTAATEAAALERFLEFTEKWEAKYPAIVRLWSNAWAQFVPFLNFDVEIRKVICTTNAIESVNSRYRRAIGPRRHFPNELAALKCLYLATMGLDPTGKGRQRWVTRWKPALNAFDITFDGRLSAGHNL